MEKGTAVQSIRGVLCRLVTAVVAVHDSGYISIPFVTLVIFQSHDPSVTLDPF